MRNDAKGFTIRSALTVIHISTGIDKFGTFLGFTATALVTYNL